MEKVQCCEMYDTGEWNDVSCGFSREPICADVTGEDCPFWISTIRSSATFVHINISMTWTEAQSYCRGHHTDLASVRNMEENQKIMGIKPPGGQVWLGLRTGTWAWSSASTAVYRNWAEREPNDSGDCVVANFDDTGKWEDWNCNDSKAFICYHGKKFHKEAFILFIIIIFWRKKCNHQDFPLNHYILFFHTCRKLFHGTICLYFPHDVCMCMLYLCMYLFMYELIN
uniref:C-type lectin domain-containing protein n=1 Tax=Oryzias melastigma TaxID=30732 RepID=A0A3B3CB26_ORYME